MTIFLLVGGASALFLGAILSSRWPALPLFAVGGLICFAWESPNTPTLVNALGTRISLADALAAVVTVTAMLNFVSRKPPKSLVNRLPIALLIVMSVFSLAKGLLNFQFGTTINESRLVLLPVAFAIWALSVNWIAQFSLLLKTALFLGWALVLVASFHGLTYGIGGASSQVQALTGDYQTGRVLVSGQALTIVLCLYITVSAWVKTRRQIYMFSSVAYLLTIIVAQHRSVWLGLIVTSILLWLLSSNAAKERILILLAGCILTIAIVQLSGVAEGFFGELSQALDDDRTYEARQGSWIQLVNQYLAGSALDLISGFPFGYGFSRVEPNGQLVTYQPHNWYVTLLLRIGIVGLAAWLALLILPMRSAGMRSNLLAFALLSTIAIYSWTYAINWYIGVFVGFAIVLANAERGLEILAENSRKSSEVAKNGI